MEPRKKKRYITSFSIDLVADLTPGSGKVLDLTQNGCRIRSNVAYNFPKEISLSLYSPYESAPITIDCAAVRWTKDDEIGLQFVQIPPSERDRLIAYLDELERARHDFQPFSPEPRQTVQTVDVKKVACCYLPKTFLVEGLFFSLIYISPSTSE